MPRKAPKKSTAVLLVEEHVIVRLALAQQLRACGYTVFEAASAHEARSILLAGPSIEILMSDARLAGPADGFALAQWVRRHRPNIEVSLTGVLSGKALAVNEFCDRLRSKPSPQDGQALTDRIRAMLAEHERRARKASPASADDRKSGGN